MTGRSSAAIAAIGVTVTSAVLLSIAPERRPWRTGREVAGFRAAPSDGATPMPLADPVAAQAPLAAERTALPGEADEGGAPPVEPPLPPPGGARLLVVDAATRLPFEGDVTVRFLHETRFAEQQGGGTIAATLTPGAWDAVVTARGFEPVELDRFVVVPGKFTELGTVGLGRGSGAIEGDVIARHLTSDESVLVELFGAGRARCGDCVGAEAPGSCCGFGDAVSTLTLPGDGRFRFPALAAGVYWLRASEPSQRIVDAVRIELRRGGTAWQLLEVSAPTVARFELRHERGGLFTGDWNHVHHERSAEIVFELRRDGATVGTTSFVPEPDDVRPTIGGPLLPDTARLVAALDAAPGGRSWEELSRGLQLSFDLGAISWGRPAGGARSDLEVPPDAKRIDRAREEGDGLLVDLAAPGLEGVALELLRVRPDCFEITPLPRAPLTVIVRCGGYASDELPLDLRHGQFQPLIVALRMPPERQAELDQVALSVPASCIACHDRAGTTTNLTIGRDLVLSLGDGVFEIVPNVEVESGSLTVEELPPATSDD